MTIFNTRYLATDEKVYVDGTGLLKNFGKIEYGLINFEKVHKITDLQHFKNLLYF